MRRILFVETTHVAIGGVGSRHARLAEALPSRGWDPIFGLTRGARFHDPRRYLENLPSLNAIELDGRTGSSEGRRLAVADAIRIARPDVIVPGAVLDAWTVAQEMKQESEPRILYGLPGINLNSIAYVARHAAGIDGGFGVSPLTADLLREFCGLPADRTFLIPTGVQPAGETASPATGNPVRLLYVGRFDPDKRVLDAIRVIDELIARGVSFQFTLLGDGLHGAELTALAATHPDRVIVRSPVPQPTLYRDVYPHADAILLFSPREGLPNALLEGMAHGLVPITSDFAGRHELGLLRDRETALVFDVGDFRAAADRIVEMIETPELKSRLGGNARALIEKERSVARMADEFAQMLDALMQLPVRLGAIPSVALEGTSRLRALVGPRWAERIRKLLRRSFEHADASEWPLIDNVVPADRDAEDARLQATVARLTRT